MTDIVLVKSQEITLPTTANTVSKASLVRLINTSNTTNHVITQRDSSNNVLGSFTLGWAGSDGSVVLVRKDHTDTLQVDTGSAVKATSVGYY